MFVILLVFCLADQEHARPDPLPAAAAAAAPREGRGGADAAGQAGDAHWLPAQRHADTLHPRAFAEGARAHPEVCWCPSGCTDDRKRFKMTFHGFKMFNFS